MHKIPYMVAGAFIGLIAFVALNMLWMLTHPYGAITNKDFPLVRIADMEGNGANGQYELSKGESKHFPYGQYKVSIPEIRASFVLWKNHRGNCDIRTASGILLVETDSNAHIRSPEP